MAESSSDTQPTEDKVLDDIRQTLETLPDLLDSYIFEWVKDSSGRKDLDLMFGEGFESLLAGRTELEHVSADSKVDLREAAQDLTERVETVDPDNLRWRPLWKLAGMTKNMAEALENAEYPPDYSADMQDHVEQFQGVAELFAAGARILQERSVDQPQSGEAQFWGVMDDCIEGLPTGLGAYLCAMGEEEYMDEEAIAHLKEDPMEELAHLSPTSHRELKEVLEAMIVRTGRLAGRDVEDIDAVEYQRLATAARNIAAAFEDAEAPPEYSERLDAQKSSFMNLAENFDRARELAGLSSFRPMTR